jgi:MerR family transcriptional regulator/heat shock protein HspR
MNARRPKREPPAPDRPLYTISVAAQLLGIHPQTLRLYERLGLVKPRRSSGKRRLYSGQDVERIETVLQLTRERGINLAGVELFLDLQDQMARLQQELDLVLRALEDTVAPTLRDMPRSGTPAVRIVIEKGEGEDDAV